MNRRIVVTGLGTGHSDRSRTGRGCGTACSRAAAGFRRRVVRHEPPHLPTSGPRSRGSSRSRTSASRILRSWAALPAWPSPPRAWPWRTPGSIRSAVEPERAGVAMGTTSGEPLEVERFDDLLLAGGDGARSGRSSATVYPCHTIATHVARELGFAGVERHDPDGLRRRQLRGGLGLRRHPRRPRRPDAGRRRRRLLAHHLHRLLAPRRHRSRRLPAVRPQSQGDDPGRGRGRAGAGAARPGARPRRARSMPRWPATASPATPIT